MSIDQESCILALPRGNTSFRLTSIKPYLTPTTQIEGIEVEPAGEESAGEEPSAEPAETPAEDPAPLPAKRPRGRPRKYQNITIHLTETGQTEEYQYQASR